MSGHTPAPWNIGFDDGSGGDPEDGIYITAPGSIVVRGGIDDWSVPRGITSYADARLISAAPDGLRAAGEAYLILLRLPHTNLRLLAQGAMCELRDFIAKATGVNAEVVQNEFEAMVAAPVSLCGNDR